MSTPDRERMTVALLSRCNGAWLVQLMDHPDGDSVPTDLITCASSLAVARRLAREGAEGFGYEPAWRWHERHYGWELEGASTWPAVESDD